ncbi:GPW/gp25 family protein [Croceibacterium ferulae]|uniref:GPW/gp25 family protein n=1 Tax=Croceibacterium ferulae TaxID=1854641 RepID=UPI000EAC65E9|nr:GPW/gp25 family protein [Croceibacterium ferulae]
MTGMSRNAGTELDGLDHIRQSVGDILGTAVGTRAGRRDYGSLLPQLIDQPMNGAGLLRVYAATALALARWENRLRLRRVQLAAGERPGAATLIIDAVRTDTAAGRAARLVLPLQP